MFTAALFTANKTRKQLKCPATDEKIKKTCVCVYTNNVEYYSGIKRMK